MRRLILTAALFVGLAVPAWADVDAGVDAWERGDYATAYQEWKPLAEAGDALAQFNLGTWYYHFEQNYEQAAKWVRFAAQQGLAQAQHDLGRFYVLGQGVRQNDVEAARWFRLAAEQEHPMAQYNLGASYYSGEGVPQDYGQAVALFRKAATAGIVMAQHNLGAMYLQSLGVQQDYQEAAMWFLLAAEQSVEAALRNIGASQAGRLGGKFPIVAGESSPTMENYREGVAYALAAAKSALGYLYAEGAGVRRDDVLAHMWFQLAANQGDPDAADNLDTLAARMTPAQIAEAQKLAREWKPKTE